VNVPEMERLAASAAALRPPEDRWPMSSLRTWIERHISAWPYELAAAELCYVAAMPDSKGPGRVLEDGPWRHRAVGHTPGPPPADPVPACDVCGLLRPYHDADHPFTSPGFTGASLDVIARHHAAAFTRGTDEP
jgi:hypothetical protein